MMIEDTPELAVPGDNVVQLHATPNIDLATLLHSTLRLTPDRIMLGEVRGPESLDLMQAKNTGHDGRCARCTATAPGRRCGGCIRWWPRPSRVSRSRASSAQPTTSCNSRGGTAPGRHLARAGGWEWEEAQAVSGPAAHSHGPAGESASLLKPLVEKRRAADHSAASAPTPGPTLGRAAAESAEETSMT